MSVMRCKMRVQEVTHVLNSDSTKESERVTLSAVSGKDDTDPNKKWSRWTPYAEFKMTINNPGAFNTLSKGHEFFVDFTPAE